MRIGHLHIAVMQLVQTLNPDMSLVTGNNVALRGMRIWGQQNLLDFFWRVQLKFSFLHGHIESLGNLFITGNIF